MGSKQLKQILEKAQNNCLEDLAEACQAEITMRPPFDYDDAHAAAQARLAEECADLPLKDCIKTAFELQSPSDYERIVARAVAEQPGISFTDLAKVYGRRDLSLVIGHFAYDRYGAFRAFINDGRPQSDVIFQRDDEKSGVRYTLRPEALDAFSELGIL